MQALDRAAKAEGKTTKQARLTMPSERRPPRPRLRRRWPDPLLLDG